MSSTMDRNEINRHFAGHVHCSQVVVKAWAEELGLDEETAMRMAAPFGGGCMNGEVCGCVTGALMLIGAEYGHCEIGDDDGNNRMIEMTDRFKAAFKEQCGTLICRELIGYDFAKPEERVQAAESGIFFERCSKYVNIALGILDEMFE